MKKAWDLYRHPSHTSRLSHCPISQNEQRRSPRQYVYRTIGVPYKGTPQAGEYTPMDIYRCHVL